MSDVVAPPRHLPTFAHALLFLLPACTSIVTPPASPAHPTAICILHDALHIGLVLPEGGTPPTRYVEYGFGDFGYYALGNDAWYHVFATVLWSTQGALSRRTWNATTPAALRRLAPALEFEELLVDGHKAESLRARLEAEFTAKKAGLVHRADFRMDFVPTDPGYWFANTCADVAANWLEGLDCTISWVPIRGSLRRG